MKEYFPKSDLFEKLAAIEHERWADWQKYCFEKMEIPRPVRVSNLGEVPFKPETDIQRWWRQIDTSYNDLSEFDKDKDREQVMRYWHLIKAD